MTVGAVIQARMGSSRLPGKVLLDIAGTSMLARVVHRVRQARTVDLVAVATSSRTLDDPVAALARELGVAVYRGDEEDVLDRFYHAAHRFALDVVVRVTADCPLIEPDVIDRAVRPLTRANAPVEFSSVGFARTFPRGIDVEVATREVLDRLWHVAREPHHRAHVFAYVYEHPGEFVTASIEDDVDRSSMRWTVDTPEDLAFVREVYGALGTGDFSRYDVLALVERRPELLTINAAVPQKTARDL